MMQNKTDILAKLAAASGKTINQYLHESKEGNYVIITADGKALCDSDGVPTIYSDKEELLKDLECHASPMMVVTEFTYWMHYAPADDGDNGETILDFVNYLLFDMCQHCNADNYAQLHKSVPFGRYMIDGVQRVTTNHGYALAIWVSSEDGEVISKVSHDSKLYYPMLTALSESAIVWEDEE